MRFLKESWANMAENEDNEARFSAELEIDDEIPINTIYINDFQQVSVTPLNPTSNN